MVDSKALWQYSHSLTILFSALMFTVSFLCVLLWTNGIVENTASAAGPSTSVLTQFSPPVNTFTITYGVAIFGIVWNALGFVALIILERDVLPISTPRLRYEVEKAAATVSVVGNALFAIASIVLMATLAKLAAGASKPGSPPGGGDRMAGQGTTAAFAGCAGISAAWACLMDLLHAQSSSYRRIVKDEPTADRIEEAEKAHPET